MPEKVDVSDSWSLYEWALENASSIYVYGPPGVGKTWLSYHHALEDKPLFALTLGEEASSVELRGHYLPMGSAAAEWHNGPLSEAMIAGRARLVINEITNASPDVLGMLYPVLEDPETSKLTLPTGETIGAQAGFQVVMTDNYEPARLPEALQDRIKAYVSVTTPHPDAFKRVHPALHEPALKAIADGTTGLRSWMNLTGYLEKGLGIEVSVAMSFGSANETLNVGIVDAMEKYKSETPAEAPPEVKHAQDFEEPTGQNFDKPSWTTARTSDGILRVKSTNIKMDE